MQTIDKETINSITAAAEIREKAFFTIMRQSGLTPQNIKNLKIKDVEKNKEIACKIHVPMEQRKGKNAKYPVFIGKEAVRYLNQYLKTRENLSTNCLLFTTHTIPEREINTKDVSRTFKRILTKKTNVLKGKASKIKLFDLVTFYRENTKEYYRQLKKHPDNENEELWRRLYEERAMPFLEIEEPIPYLIRGNRKRLQKEIKELTSQNVTLKRTIAKDTKFISEILTLIYNNIGDPETGENEKIGRDFVELWKELQNKQWFLPTYVGFRMPFEWLDIVEELTKKLKEIKKPYDDFEAKYGVDLNTPFDKLEPNEAQEIGEKMREFTEYYRKLI